MNEFLEVARLFFEQNKYSMRINEDYIDQDNIIDQPVVDADEGNSVFIIQDRRPISKLLKGWDFIVHVEVGDYWTKADTPEDMKNIELTFLSCAQRIHNAIERLPYNVDMSPIVIGSGLTKYGWYGSKDGGGFTTYDKYILGNTEDDKGYPKITKLYFGIRLEQNQINLQKAFIALSQVSKIIFKITNTNAFHVLYHTYLWDSFYIHDGTGIGSNMQKCLRRDMEDACVSDEPNFYGIDRWLDALCIFSGHTHKDISKDYDFTMEEIRKFREMLRKHF